MADGGLDRSRRPFELFAMEEAVIGAVDGADGLKAELNSPNPSEALLTFRTASGGGACETFGAGGFGGGFGPASKKPPPASGGVFIICGGLLICGGAGADLVGGEVGLIPGKGVTRCDEGCCVGCGGL